MKDILNGLVAQYNKMTSVKRHRIDTPKRALVYNMLLSQVWFVHCMYVLAVFCNISKLVWNMRWNHNWGFAPRMPYMLCFTITMTNSDMRFQVWGMCPASPAFMLLPTPGLPLDVLQGDWWVPGSTSRADLARFSGKGQWKEILTVTPEVTLMWAERATQDHKFLLVWCFLTISYSVKLEILWSDFLLSTRTSAARCQKTAATKRRTWFYEMVWMRLCFFKVTIVYYEMVCMKMGFLCLFEVTIVNDAHMLIILYWSKSLLKDLKRRTRVLFRYPAETGAVGWGEASIDLWHLLRLEVLAAEVEIQFSPGSTGEVQPTVLQGDAWLWLGVSG